MIKQIKKVISYTLLTLISVTPLFSFTDEDNGNDLPDWGRIRIYYSINSDYLFAYLQINKKHLGRIYRGKTRTFRIRPGKLIRIRVYRKEDVHTKYVRVNRGQTKSAFMELRWKDTDKSKDIAKLAVYYSISSIFRYAFIKINGRYLGIIRRGQTRYFKIPPGICKLKIYRRGRRILRKFKVIPGTKRRITIRFRRNEEDID